MAHFSIRSVSALVDVISGGPGNDGQPPVGVYRTGAKLVEFFGQCGVEFRPGDRSRVPATRATIDAINEDPEGRAQLEKIIERCVALRSCNDDEGLRERVVAYLNIHRLKAVG